MSDVIYTQDVTDILDLFFENDGQEPDWAAIHSRLFTMTDSYFQVIMALLKTFHLVYEDPASFRTLLYRLTQDDATP